MYLSLRCASNSDQDFKQLLQWKIDQLIFGWKKRKRKSERKHILTYLNSLNLDIIKKYMLGFQVIQRM